MIDATDPFAPMIIASLETPGGARGVAVSGDLAYVSDNGVGMEVVDISGDGPNNNGIPVTVEVSEKALDVGEAIFMPNHTSTIDILVLFLALSRDVRFVSKKELF